MKSCTLYPSTQLHKWRNMMLHMEDEFYGWFFFFSFFMWEYKNRFDWKARILLTQSKINDMVASCDKIIFASFKKNWVWIQGTSFYPAILFNLHSPSDDNIFEIKFQFFFAPFSVLKHLHNLRWMIQCGDLNVHKWNWSC